MQHHHHTEHSSQPAQTDHGSHAGHMISDFRRRFWVSLILSAPVFGLSPMIQQLLYLKFALPFQEVATFILATVIFIYGGWPFLTGLLNELKAKQPGMMTLVAVAITTA